MRKKGREQQKKITMSVEHLASVVARTQSRMVCEELDRFESRLGLRIPSRREEESLAERIGARLVNSHSDESPPLPLKAALYVASSIVPVEPEDVLRKLAGTSARIDQSWCDNENDGLVKRMTMPPPRSLRTRVESIYRRPKLPASSGEAESSGRELRHNGTRRPPFITATKQKRLFDTYRVPEMQLSAGRSMNSVAPEEEEARRLLEKQRHRSYREMQRETFRRQRQRASLRSVSRPQSARWASTASRRDVVLDTRRRHTGSFMHEIDDNCGGDTAAMGMGRSCGAYSAHDRRQRSRELKFEEDTMMLMRELDSFRGPTYQKIRPHSARV